MSSNVIAFSGGLNEVSRVWEDQNPHLMEAASGCSTAAERVTKLLEEQLQQEELLRKQKEHAGEPPRRMRAEQIVSRLDLSSETDPVKLFNLGDQFAKGESGRTKDREKALQCYERAADLGSHDAHFAMGEIFGKGLHSFPESSYRAIYHYTRAAELGNARAMGCLSRAHAQLLQGSVEADLWHRQAVLGNARAMGCLSRAQLLQGSIEADLWHRQAVVLGDLEARKDFKRYQRCPAELHRLGDSMIKKSQELMRESAECAWKAFWQDGWRKSMGLRARLFYSTSIDFGLVRFVSYSWRSVKECLHPELDEQQRNRTAQEHFLGLNGYEQNPDKGLKILEDRALQGSSEAYFEMGQIFERGLYSFAEDPYRALHYYRKAAEFGHLGAIVQVSNSELMRGTLEQERCLYAAYIQKVPRAVIDFNSRYDSVEKLDALAKRIFLASNKLIEEGVRCYEEAGAQEYGKSYLKLGSLYATWYLIPPKEGKSQASQAFDEYHRAMSKGAYPDRSTFANLLNFSSAETCHFQGDRLLIPYPAAAYDCYEKARDVDGYRKMAEMHTSGIGVEKDPVKAFECYEQAYSRRESSKEVSFAKEISSLTTDLNLLTSFGDRSRDPNVKILCFEAVLEVYHIAVNNRERPSISCFTNNLSSAEMCHSHGDRLLTPYPEAAYACYKKARDVDGYKKMAEMHTSGRGAAKDPVKAFECYEQAYSSRGWWKKVSFAKEISLLTTNPELLKSFGDRSRDPDVKRLCYPKAGLLK